MTNDVQCGTRWGQIRMFIDTSSTVADHPSRKRLVEEQRLSSGLRVEDYNTVPSRWAFGTRLLAVPYHRASDE